MFSASFFSLSFLSPPVCPSVLFPFLCVRYFYFSVSSRCFFFFLSFFNLLFTITRLLFLCFLPPSPPFSCSILLFLSSLSPLLRPPYSSPCLFLFSSSPSTILLSFPPPLSLTSFFAYLSSLLFISHLHKHKDICISSKKEIKKILIIFINLEY